MFIPTMVKDRLVDENGFLTKEWANLFEQLLTNMQQALSNEGFLVPSQSQSNMALIQSGVNPTGEQIAIAGTLLFNTDTVNGGSPTSPRGQLYILLKDGVFHPITNT